MPAQLTADQLESLCILLNNCRKKAEGAAEILDRWRARRDTVEGARATGALEAYTYAADELAAIIGEPTKA